MGARGKNFYNDLTRRYGYEEAAEKVQDLYLSGKKAEAIVLTMSALGSFGDKGFLPRRQSITFDKS